jgi:integrase
VSLAEAHDKATALRKVARAGGDPLAERDRDKAIPTFEQSARAVHAAHAKGWRNAKHSAQWLSTLEQYAFPHFGALLVSAVDTTHVLAALSPIWLTKPETARRVRQRIGLVLDWASAHRHRTGDNPCDTVSEILPKQPDSEQHHAALPYSELPAFVTDLRQASTSESIKLALEFLILTATRTNETLLAQWQEIDLEGTKLRRQTRSSSINTRTSAT